MKLLAIESSAVSASAALTDGGRLIAEYFTDYKKTHSQTLLPMIDEIIRMTETDMGTLNAIAVSGGPGSFTGLRIGASTAKGLALALDIPIVSVSTLAAIACNFTGEKRIICPVMDARRDQVYTALYRFEGGELRTLAEDSAMSVGELTAFLNEKHPGEEIIFAGDGTDRFKDEIATALGDRAFFAAPHLNRPRAGALAAYAERLFDEGKTVTADDFAPVYLRQSQAEREYVEVSAATDADISFIAGLEKECFTDAWTSAMIESHFGNRCNGALVAKRKGTPCGYVLYQTVSGEGELFRIAVSSELRRAGIGSRLISAMEDASGADFWSLEVRASNESAIKLYESRGYVTARIRQDYYSDPAENAVIMEHRIRE